jgi:hypothetical protein
VVYAPVGFLKGALLRGLAEVLLVSLKVEVAERAS